MKQKVLAGLLRDHLKAKDKTAKKEIQTAGDSRSSKTVKRNASVLEGAVPRRKAKTWVLEKKSTKCMITRGRIGEKGRPEKSRLKEKQPSEPNGMGIIRGSNIGPKKRNCRNHKKKIDI